jgi:D-serine deaminase-like pyridoxal phosphate-dependent protein
MDGYHHQLDPCFEQATTVLSTCISRHPDRIVFDAGNKSVGATKAVFKGYNYPEWRFDEEHCFFKIGDTCQIKIGDTVELLCIYTPFAVSYFEAYHVIEGDRVVDIWPVLPRGPESR